MSSTFNTLLREVNERNQNVDLVGSNSLFGSMGRGGGMMGAINKGFIPLDGNGKTLDLTGNSIDVQARWLGLENRQMQYWAYNYCSPLATVIDRLAEADANGKLEFIDEDENTVKKVSKIPNLNRIKKLLKKPNPGQTWMEFDSEQVVLCKTYGYCPVFAICPSGMDKSYTKFLFNLNPYLLTPEVNNDYSLYGNKEGDNVNRQSKIKKWSFTIANITYSIDAKDILLIKDGFMNQHPDTGLPLSKIAGLDFFVSNICAAMEADNVLLKKKGPLGVFSHDPKPDIAGWTPLSPDEKDELQNDLKQYGLTLGQLQYVISKTPLKWNAMSFNLRDLMTKETVRQGVDGICDRFSYPAELMSGKNATYENRTSAEKWLYQNNIIPFSLRRMAAYSEFFDLGEYSLYLDYDHIPCLQDDILQAGQASKAESQGLLVEWEAGMITWNQWQLSKDRDTVAGMDIYYPEWIKSNPEMKKETKVKKDVKAKQ